MVGKPEEYHWSHYKDYIGLNKSPDWLNTDFVLNLFAKKVTVARAEYGRFVESMVDMEYESPLKEVFASTILGSRDFINEIGDYFGIGVSGVSQASRRFGMQIKDDKGLKKKVNKLIMTNVFNDDSCDIIIYPSVLHIISNIHKKKAKGKYLECEPLFKVPN